MKIKEVEIKNFRFLEDVTVTLDNDETIIVGKNNTGKTSLIELFHKFFGSSNTHFQFEDFSLGTHKKFNISYNLFLSYQKAIQDEKDEWIILANEKRFKLKIPKISVGILIKYQKDDDLANLSSFIKDLDPDRQDAFISCEYTISSPEKLFKDFESQKSDYYHDLTSFLQENIDSYYNINFFAVDHQNRANRDKIDNRSDLEKIFLPNFIYAQRQLDDQHKDGGRRLSKSFEDYYRFNNGENEDVDDLEDTLRSMSDKLDSKYESLFEGIFDDLEMFGVKSGVDLQNLTIRSKFDAENILKGNSNFFYEQENTLLPESYNGLGYSNLIYITLRFISFYEEFIEVKPRPYFQIVFIEEPEAHLHPQMQYVFIKNVNEFISKKKDWNVQLIITTHSSHIIAKSGFKNIRYFDDSEGLLKVKNLSKFKKTTSKEAIKFLEQYLSLKRCDMFFADKIIMVEGTVERLLIPRMVEKTSKKLKNMYVSIIEVGGAYAHKFKDLLEFINVKTLIITDIDSIDSSANNNSCPVSEGDKTSNGVLKKWLPQSVSLNALHSCNSKEKSEGKFRVAYQIKEDGIDKCGRSFEEAFIIANSQYLECSSNGTAIISNLFDGLNKEEIVESSYTKADKISDKKTDFAFDIMLLESWDVPKYIEEGLLWLEK